jgi:hypothetical protein
MAGRGVAAAALAASVLLCAALAVGWSAAVREGGSADARAAAGRRQVELAVRAQRVGRTKQLETQAMREAALARLEAKVGCVCARACLHACVCVRARRCRLLLACCARPSG